MKMRMIHLRIETPLSPPKWREASLPGNKCMSKPSGHLSFRVLSKSETAWREGEGRGKRLNDGPNLQGG